MDVLREGFDYRFSRLDPMAPHIDPPSVAIYEPLLAKGPDWRAHALLARDWTISDDGLQWRFELREELRFHSGAACDADAVVAALELLRRPVGVDDQIWYWDPVDTVQASGTRAVTVTLRHPYARLPSLLWGTHTALHNEALRAADPDRFGREVADGTGPYRLLSWSEEVVVAERWDDYPPPLARFLELPGRSPERIEWHAVLDPGDRLAALEAGELHCIHAPPLDRVDQLVDEHRFEVIEFPQQSNIYLALDFRERELLFDQRRLREAISRAIDRDALVRDVLHGHGGPSFNGIPAGDEHYDATTDRGAHFDRAAATRMLDELVPHAGADGIRVTPAGARMSVRCVCQDDAVLRPLAEAVRDQLRQVGIELVLDPVVPFAPFYDVAAAGTPAVLSKWLWPDPIDAVIGFTATRAISSDNWQHSSIPELDAAFDAWLRAGEGELAASATRVQSVIARELPYIPLVTPNDVWVHVRELTGYRPFKANLYPFYQPVRLSPRRVTAHRR